MTANVLPKWLQTARELFSISQAGLTYCKNDFDLERYRRLREIAAEIVADESNLSKEEVAKSFSIQAGYATPKVDVRGAVIQDGKILLVQERTDQRWALPGGWCDLGMAPSLMAEREVWEESGFQVKANKIVALYDANRIPFAPLEFYHAYKIIFLCELIGGQATPSIETSDVGFFSLNSLPPLSEYRTNRDMIEEVIAHIQNPNRQAAFD